MAQAPNRLLAVDPWKGTPMKTTTSIFLNALFVLIFAGCDTGSLVSPEVLQLNGSWEWVKTVGGFAPQIRTPESTGHTANVVFHYNGTAKFFADGGLLYESRYVVTRKRPTPASDEITVIEFLDAPMPWIEQMVSFQGDTLYLTDLCLDCYQHTYVRIP